MKTPLRVLLVEDSPDDAELLSMELRLGGYDVELERVDTREAMERALARVPWDIVISDYEIPMFGGMAALETLRTTGIDVPFIIVSGTIGEEVAVQMMKAGASDYILKDKLTRLCAAVERELREAALRREGRRAKAKAIDATEQLELRERVVEYMPIGVMVFERQGGEDAPTFRLMWRNPAAKAATFVDDDMVGATLDQGFPKLRNTELPQAMARALETGRVQSLPLLQHVDERNRQTVWKVEAVPLGTCMVGIFFNDITEQQNMEQQMRAAQRMEAVGRLAGGIAHDFNNIVTVIDSYAGFLLDQFRPGDPAREDVGMIRDAAARAARLTSQLLAFSRQQPRELAVLDLNRVLNDLDGMLRRLIGADIELVTKAGEPLGSVKADPSQIEQVVMNLVVNARDAMPKGGRLTLETADIELDEVYGGAKGEIVPKGSYVMLAVSDTGTGMGEEVRQQIFEPFFTTKERGRGTGLGLSTVFGIVKQSGGYIWVYSEVGKGTTFKVYLPRLEESNDCRAQPRARPAIVGGTERILLVEDEDMLRKAAVRMLAGAGYDVLEASNGGAALLIAEREREPIHLLVTDVIMPIMSGKELADRLSALHPAMRVIYMSGYTDNAITHHGVLHPGTVYLQKPFSPDGLLAKVREVLDWPNDPASEKPPRPSGV